MSPLRLSELMGTNCVPFLTPSIRKENNPDELMREPNSTLKRDPLRSIAVAAPDSHALRDFMAGPTTIHLQEPSIIRIARAPVVCSPAEKTVSRHLESYLVT